MADSNREKALNLALGSIEKAYGKGSIMRLGDADAKVKAAEQKAAHAERKEAKRAAKHA